jgi:enediyne biosynthesis protein E4
VEAIIRGSRREVLRQLLHFQSAVFSSLLVLLVISVALWPRTEPASPEAPRPTFSEVARSAGIQATMRCGGPEKRWITEANGSGVAWLDYDNDGLMDLLIVNGAGMVELRKILGGEIPAATGPGVYLFHNLGNGRFEDVTARSGLTNPYWGTGANAADFDNDGYTDILITTIGRDLLYRNNHDGTFTEVGGAAGLSRDVAWHTGSAFGDFDGDGWLDLFVTGYIDVHAVSFAEPAPVCDYLGKHTFCGPNGLKGARGILYHNNGDGTFRDITRQAGLATVAPAHGFTVVADDFNQDGKLDLFVANDSDPNYLFLNQGNGTFKEVALDKGLAYNADGRAQSNMGVAVGDLSRSGRLDVAITTFYRDYFPVFRQAKNGEYEEVSVQTGLAAATSAYLGWGCGFADFANDGAKEFWSANGHVYPQVDSYFQPFAIFGLVAGRFAATYLYPPIPDNSYRGAAVADYDNDGLMDVAVLPIAGSPLLLHNETKSPRGWVGLALRGTKSNRDAIGASVRLSACGVEFFDTVRNGGSYISRNDPRLHFGLGGCGKITRLTVRWPSGTEQVLHDLPANRYITIEEAR